MRGRSDMTNVTDISTRQQVPHRPDVPPYIEQPHAMRASSSSKWLALVWFTIATVTAVATALLFRDHPLAAAVAAVSLATLTIMRSRLVRMAMSMKDHNLNQQRGRIIADNLPSLNKPVVVQPLRQRQPRVLAQSPVVIPFRTRRTPTIGTFNRPPRILRPASPHKPKPFWHDDTARLAKFPGSGNDNLPPVAR